MPSPRPSSASQCDRHGPLNGHVEEIVVAESILGEFQWSKVAGESAQRARDPLETRIGEHEIRLLCERSPSSHAAQTVADA
jgi:hypothetical protein